MNMQNLLKQAQKMQAEITKAEAALKEREYETAVGGGALQIKINGAFEVQEVNINPDVLSADNKEMIEEMIQMAFQEVFQKAAFEKEQVMSSLTGGVKMPGGF
ncbi:MAG: YbaB/EbfC family nucleoid-associated protein [Erysipelotrichaceae bacterium]